VRVGNVESSAEQSGLGALLVGGLAATLASTCCLGPMVLVALGLSGAWIGELTKLEPYRLYFVGGAAAALFFAGRRIFRPARSCELGEVCALPQTRRAHIVLFGIVSVLVLTALVYPYAVRFFY
jgi:mercuric ion transport protein